MTQYYEKVSVKDALPENQGDYVCFVNGFERIMEYTGKGFEEKEYRIPWDVTHWLRPVQPISNLSEKITEIIRNEIQYTEPLGTRYLDKLENLLRGDAVLFVEWVSKKGYEIEGENWVLCTDLWQEMDADDNSDSDGSCEFTAPRYTTEQLYQKYIQEENK
jgi:hypothetical protein